MSYTDYLKALLRPLGLYDLDGTRNGAELACYGDQLDLCSRHLAETEQEMNLVTAQGMGLEQYLQLLGHRPVTDSSDGLRTALAALFRIGTGSFTLAAINDNLAGCGVEAVVRETAEQDVVEVVFPHLYLNQSALRQMIRVIEEIIPCHLQINYLYWATRWGDLSTGEQTWAALSDGQNTWLAISLLVQVKETQA